MKIRFRLLPFLSLVAIACSTSLARSSPARDPDRVNLCGTWSWTGSVGGIHPDGDTPNECGCRRFLTLTRTGKYRFIEEDSVNEYLLCEGSYSIHQSGQAAEGTQREFWVAFRNWWIGEERDQSLRLAGARADTLLALSLGPGYSPDSNFHRFVRVIGPSADSSAPALRAPLPLSARPARWDQRYLPPTGKFPSYEVAPIPLSQPGPVYPGFARSAQAQGLVILRALVGTDGRVKDIKLLRGISGLNEAAVNTVKEWVYKPALGTAGPVPAWIKVPVRFRLHPRGGVGRQRPVPARDIPDRVLLNGRDALIARVGKEFYERHLSLDSSRCLYWVDAGAAHAGPLRDSSAGTEMPGTPVEPFPPGPLLEDPMEGVRWSLVYRLRVSHAPWAQREVWFDVDSTGVQTGERGFCGLIDCARHPEECTFSIDERAAREIAKAAGLRSGIKPWTVSFQLWEDAPFSRYVWLVRSTVTIDSNGLRHGESVAIDASTGQVLATQDREIREWSDRYIFIRDVGGEKRLRSK